MVLAFPWGHKGQRFFFFNPFDNFPHYLSLHLILVDKQHLETLFWVPRESLQALLGKENSNYRENVGKRSGSGCFFFSSWNREWEGFNRECRVKESHLLRIWVILLQCILTLFHPRLPLVAPKDSVTLSFSVLPNMFSFPYLKLHCCFIAFKKWKPVIFFFVRQREM